MVDEALDGRAERLRRDRLPEEVGTRHGCLCAFPAPGRRRKSMQRLCAMRNSIGCQVCRNNEQVLTTQSSGLVEGPRMCTR
jgi:hypothetical protein